MNMSPDQFWALEQRNQQNRQEFMQGQMENVMSGLAGLAQTYSDNKAMEAKASSYDKIGDILGSAMFSGNDVAMNALGELKKSKDPREKVMGYETLFSLMGPYSNFMMANRNAGIRENQQALTAAMPNLRNAAAAQAQVAAGQGTMGVPPNVNLDYVTDR
jgi:hypothetical protein